MFEPVEEWTGRTTEVVGWVAALKKGSVLMGGVAFLYLLSFWLAPVGWWSVDSTLVAYGLGVFVPGLFVFLSNGLLLWRYPYRGWKPWLRLLASLPLYLGAYLFTFLLIILLGLPEVLASLAPSVFAVYHMILVCLVLATVLIVFAMRCFNQALERPVLFGLAATVVIVTFLIPGLLPGDAWSAISFKTLVAQGRGHMDSVLGPGFFIPSMAFITLFVLRPVGLKRDQELQQSRHYHAGAVLFSLGLFYLLYSVNLLLQASVGMPVL